MEDPDPDDEAGIGEEPGRFEFTLFKAVGKRFSIVAQVNHVVVDPLLSVDDVEGRHFDKVPIQRGGVVRELEILEHGCVDNDLQAIE